MQQRMNAKEYAKARGLPVETIRRLCRTNVLKYVQRGKVYLVRVPKKRRRHGFPGGHGAGLALKRNIDQSGVPRRGL